MSRKKYTDQNSKVLLYEELKEKLEEMFNQLESAEIRYNDAEHADYINLVVRPFEDLIDTIDIFATNISNDVYTVDNNFEDYNED